MITCNSINIITITNIMDTEQDRKSLKSIIKWSGGKQDEIKQILPYIPKTYSTYLEPFIGGRCCLFSFKSRKSSY